MGLKGTNKALKEGCKVYSFRSGGGLRVIRIEKGKKLMGYGDYWNVEIALSRASKEYLTGKDQNEPRYLTGSSTASSPLDSWILRGRDLEAWRENDKIVCQLKGLAYVEYPKDITEEVIKTGKPVVWTSDRGYTYRLTKYYYADSAVGVISEVIKRPEGDDFSIMYHITKTGYGKNFSEAVKNALRAKEVEVK